MWPTIEPAITRAHDHSHRWRTRSRRGRPPPCRPACCRVPASGPFSRIHDRGRLVPGDQRPAPAWAGATCSRTEALHIQSVVPSAAHTSAASRTPPCQRASHGGAVIASDAAIMVKMGVGESHASPLLANRGAPHPERRSIGCPHIRGEPDATLPAGVPRRRRDRLGCGDHGEDGCGRAAREFHRSPGLETICARSACLAVVGHDGPSTLAPDERLRASRYGMRGSSHLRAVLARHDDLRRLLDRLTRAGGEVRRGLDVHPVSDGPAPALTPWRRSAATRRP